MAARTRALIHKDKKQHNGIPSTDVSFIQASTIRKNCKRCFKEIVEVNDNQSIFSMERSRSETPQTSRTTSGSGIITSTYNLWTGLCSTPERRITSGTSRVTDAVVGPTSIQTQTDERMYGVLYPDVKRKKTLVLGCDLDLDPNYMASSSCGLAQTLLTRFVKMPDPSSFTRYFKQWSWIVAMLVFTASISYIVMHMHHGRPESQFLLPYTPQDIKKHKIDLDSDIVSLKDAISSFQDKLTVKMDIFSHQYNSLKKNLQQLSDTINTMKESVQLRNSRNININDICAKKVREEIAIYDADKLGIADYALESSGGSILSMPDTELYNFDSWITIWNIPLWGTQRSPRKIIQASVHPGECWAFAGSTGTVVIRLIVPIHITAVTMEHIPANISPSDNINSAPRTFVVIGLEAAYDSDGTRLGLFTYSIPGTPRQTFAINEQVARRRLAFSAVKLQILTNYGNMKYTCVYRFRVHGIPIAEMGFV